MKTRLAVVLLLAGASLFAETHVSIGIGVGGYGGYYAAPPEVVYQPPCPGPDYAWVDGYWESVGPRRCWRHGYWARRHYESYRHYDRDPYYGDRYYGNEHHGYGGYGNGFRNSGHGEHWNHERHEHDRHEHGRHGHDRD